MRSPAGGFYSSQDADSEGVEGKFFVWDLDEVASLAPDLVDTFEVTERGNWEHSNILTRRDETEVPDQRQALFDTRAQRVHPGLDDKVLVAWSSLMAGALAECGRILEREDFVRAAVEAVDFVEREMRRADGRLLRAWRDGQVGSIPAFCEDYGHHADALIDVYEATFDRRHLDAARRTYEDGDRLFGDPDGAGWFATGADADPLITRPKDYIDNAVPSASSSMTRAGLRLALHLGDAALAERPLEWLRTLGAAAARQPLAFGHVFGALHWVLTTVKEVAFIGDDPELRRPVWERYIPNRALAGLEPYDDLPLLAGKTLINGEPAAYVCESYACLRPVTTPDELRALLG
jgi:uncharacterized protein YyaL (SSP411 family)